MLGLPCILKQPDSAFSLGVVEGRDAKQALHDARRHACSPTPSSSIAQEWLPTHVRLARRHPRPAAALRLQVLHGARPLAGHQARVAAQRVEGRPRRCRVGEAPQIVVDTALRAANLIGDGFYGVDIKQVGDAVLRDRGQRQPERRRRQRGRRARRRALPRGHGRVPAPDRSERRREPRVVTRAVRAPRAFARLRHRARVHDRRPRVARRARRSPTACSPMLAGDVVEEAVERRARRGPTSSCCT